VVCTPSPLEEWLGTAFRAKSNAYYFSPWRQSQSTMDSGSESREKVPEKGRFPGSRRTPEKGSFLDFALDP